MRQRETRQIFGYVLMAEGNKPYINIGAAAMKLRETNPTSLRETRPTERKPRSKLSGSTRPRETRSNFVWVQKAEGNKALISLGSQGQGKRIL